MVSGLYQNEVFMRKLFCIFTLISVILIPSYLFAACGGAPTESPTGTWTTYDASYDCVNDAVQNYATAGETVQVANGNATWTSSLVINKSLVLKGGTGTITYNLSGYVIDFYPAAPTSGKTFEMSGFTFTNSSGSWFRAYNSNSTSGYITIKIHDNTVNSTASDQSIDIKTESGVVYGVVYKNTLNFGASSGNRFDLLADGSNTWNNYSSEPGTSNNLFIEDNTINYTPDGGGPFATGQGLKGVVIRYNDITHYYGQLVADMHGTYYTWGCGTMLGEIYGNKIIQTNAGPYVLEQRGGQAFVFYNAITGNSDIGSRINQDDADGGNCLPEPDVQDENVSNSYYWDMRSSSGSGNLYGIYSNASSNRVENTHFWVMRSGTFNGTGNAANGGGVGCGTAATMNAISTCTDGVAFWVPNATIDPTAGSCLDFSSYIGADNATASSVSGNIGTLYRCSSNAWVSYYTPYTYPHPLRGTTSPSATGCTISGGTFR